MKWYYAQNNQRQGPVSENEFDFLVHQKKITPDMLVWNETMPAWRPLREVQPEAAPVPPPYDWTARPALETAPPPPPPRDGPAWEKRDAIGGLRAATQTVVELLTASSRTFARMKPVSDWVGPFCFAMFFWGVASYANFFYLIVACRALQGSVRMPLQLLTSNYFAGFMLVGFYFFIPFAVAILVFVSAAVIHLCLRLAGAGELPFQTTYRVVCYSLGASAVLKFIPMVGPLLAAVFNLVLLVRGIAGVHGVAPSRVILAMTPVVLCTGLYILLHILA